MISSTDWEWAPHTLIRVKRYFIANAFPFASRKHLATAQVLTVAELAHPGLSYKALDTAAEQELMRVIEGEPPRWRNTVRFNEYDVLPTDRNDW